MPFSLGAKSLKELVGVHPQLVAVVKEAIKFTRQDFTVYDGLRTKAEAIANVKKGVSKTTNSMHLPQADGFAHAVDLVPIVDGRPQWLWPEIYPIAEAVELAADKLGVELIWGAVWDKRLGTYGSTAADMQRECAAYVQRRKKMGRSAFIDGPHFELAK